MVVAVVDVVLSGVELVEELERVAGVLVVLDSVVDIAVADVALVTVDEEEEIVVGGSVVPALLVQMKPLLPFLFLHLSTVHVKPLPGHFFLAFLFDFMQRSGHPSGIFCRCDCN